MLLSQALEEFDLSRVGRPRDTRNWYQRMLRPMFEFLGDVEIETITISDLRHWHQSLEDRDVRWANHPRKESKPGGLAPRTIYAHVKACRTFFNWLVDEDHLSCNPAHKLRLPDLPQDEPKKDISQEDARRIIAAAQANPRDYAILRFLAETGCRACGLADLRLGDLVNLEPDRRGRYRAIVREKCKGGKGKRRSRRVYFKAATARALIDYLQVRPDLDPDVVGRKEVDRVWVTENGAPLRPLQEEGVYRMIERYAKRLGITGKWNTHAWRHAFAHALLDNGADVGLVSQLMGHKDVATTLRAYGKRADGRLADEHAHYSWVEDVDDLWPGSDNGKAGDAGSLARPGHPW